MALLIIILISLFISSSFILAVGSFDLSATNVNSSEILMNSNLSTVGNVQNPTKEKEAFSLLPTSNPLQYLVDSVGHYHFAGETRKRLFYYFFHSPNNVDKPVVMWLGAESGESCNVAVFYGNGPVRFAQNSSNELIWNDNGWNTVFNIIYIDQPFGTGFSYASSISDMRQNRVQVINDLYNFVKAFFRQYHAYATNEFFIAGQSNAGTYAYGLADRIHQVNKALNKQSKASDINLQGVVLGNSLIDLGTQYATIPNYAKINDLVTDVDVVNLETLIDPCKASILACERGYEGMCLEAFRDCSNILDQTIGKIGDRDYLNINNGYDYDYSKMIALLNEDSTKRMLGVSNIPFNTYNDEVCKALRSDWAINNRKEIVTLLNDGIEILSYAGEYDLEFNYLGVMESLLELNWTGQRMFKESLAHEWSIDGENVDVGLRKTYGPLTHIKVRGAGSMVHVDEPEVALIMIQMWMNGEFI